MLNTHFCVPRINKDVYNNAQGNNWIRKRTPSVNAEVFHSSTVVYFPTYISTRIVAWRPCVECMCRVYIYVCVCVCRCVSHLLGICWMENVSEDKCWVFLLQVFVGLERSGGVSCKVFPQGWGPAPAQLGPLMPCICRYIKAGLPTRLNVYLTTQVRRT